MKNIQTKLISYSVILISSTILLLVPAISGLFVRNMSHLSEQAALSVLHAMAVGLDEDFYQLRVDKIRMALAGTARHFPVVNSFALDRNGVVLSDGTKQNPMAGAVLQDPFAQKLMDQQQEIFVSSKGNLLRKEGNR